MKLVMTGASGFLGAHVHRVLLEAGHSVVRLGRRGPEMPVDLVRDEPHWDSSSGATTLLHCAGIMAADAAAVLDSARMAVNLLAGLPATATRIVLVSSAYVYAPSAVPSGEDVAPEPADVYGRAKLAVEELFRGVSKATGRSLVILRPCAIYGPGDPHQKVITRFVADARRGIAPALKGPASFARDYIHVGDAARAVRAAVEKERADGDAHVFNVCTGRSWSAVEIARLVGELAPSVATKIDAPETEAIGYRFDPSRATRELGFRAEVDLRAALASLLSGESGEQQP